MSNKEWLDEYINNINKNPYLNLNGFIDIVHDHFPQKLYRYRALSNDVVDYNGNKITKAEREINNFERNAIYLASREEFNDPYDAKPLYNKEKMLHKFIHSKKNQKRFRKETEKILSLPKNFLKGNYTSVYKNLVQEQLEKKLIITNNYRMACFTENNDNILMWSHYANYHKGYCIEYDISNFKENEKYSKHLFPVIYSEKILDLSDTLTNAILGKKNRTNTDKNYWFYCALYKAKCWEYENEWRFVYHNIVNKLNNKKNILFPKPTKIFFGTKIEKENRDKLIKIAKQNNISCFDMKMEISKYKLYPKPI